MIKWRKIPSFPEYEVSDNGIVRRDGHILKLGYTVEGYSRCSLKAKGKWYVRRVHTLVAEAFIGPRPEGYDCCHNDGNSGNNNVSNLRWDTRKSNVADNIKHGKFVPFEKHWKAKLTFDKVLEIRKNHKPGNRGWFKYGISKGHYFHIINGTRWTSHIASPLETIKNNK